MVGEKGWLLRAGRNFPEDDLQFRWMERARIDRCQNVVRGDCDADLFRFRIAS